MTPKYQELDEFTRSRLRSIQLKNIEPDYRYAVLGPASGVVFFRGSVFSGPVRPLYTSRHSREGGNPVCTGGIPAFAGMTTVKIKPVDLTGPVFSGVPEAETGST
jgi:hypothetical protein